MLASIMMSQATGLKMSLLLAGIPLALAAAEYRNIVSKDQLKPRFRNRSSMTTISEQGTNRVYWTGRVPGEINILGKYKTYANIIEVPIFFNLSTMLRNEPLLKELEKLQHKPTGMSVVMTGVNGQRVPVTVRVVYITQDELSRLTEFAVNDEQDFTDQYYETLASVVELEEKEQETKCADHESYEDRIKLVNKLARNAYYVSTRVREQYTTVTPDVNGDVFFVPKSSVSAIPYDSLRGDWQRTVPGSNSKHVTRADRIRAKFRDQSSEVDEKRRSKSMFEAHRRVRKYNLKRDCPGGDRKPLVNSTMSGNTRKTKFYLDMKANEKYYHDPNLQKPAKVEDTLENYIIQIDQPDNVQHLD